MMKKLVLIHLKSLIIAQFLFVSLAQANIPPDLLKSAESGEANAQYAVARAYQLGKRVKSDKAKAIEWYTKAADQGHTDAAYRLGLLYYKGLGGFKIDLKKAFHYINLAAKKNHKNSQANLAKMYENGDGVKRDENLSDYWYEQAFTSKTQSYEDYLKDDEIPPAAAPAVVEAVKPLPVATVVHKKTVKNVAVSSKKIKFPDIIVDSEWLQKGKASIYLNSSANKCKFKNNKLICSTSKLRGRHSTGSYKYKLRSIITPGNDVNDLHIEYRKLYTSVPEKTIEAYADEADSTESGLTVGWENKSHRIDCHFENAKSILCRPIGEDAFYIKSK